MPLSISVVTPSFNQGEFLARALASVAAQSFAPLEHLVFDPGSQDGSREIAERAKGVTLIAEPDKGQADAVARGMLAARGDIVAWLNSDDEYFDESVFQSVADAFASPDAPDIVYGRGVYVGKDGELLKDAYVIADPENLAERLAREVGVLQPATFISRSLIERIGPVDPDLHFCMDYEYWIRAVQAGAKFKFIDPNLARARFYPENKTASRRDDSYAEVVTMLKKKFGFAHFNWLRRLADFQVNSHDGVISNYGNVPNDRGQLSKVAYDLNFRVNGDFATIGELRRPEKSRLAGHTTIVCNTNLQHHAAAYARPITDGRKRAARNTYKVGPQRWAFDEKWLETELTRSDAIFERLSRNRASDICIIVGNGPSLNNTDLSEIGGADCFISNYALLDRKLLALSKYLCVTNYLVAEQQSESFNLLENVVKFTPYWLSYCLLPTPDTCYVRSVGHPEFSADFRKNISWRSTVSFFAMQVAFALGYRKALLIGFDHSYRQSSSVEGDIISQADDDENHFDARYFKGKRWQAADTSNMEAMYRLAKTAFEKDGREIVNCTVGGKLELFRRGDLKEEIRSPPRRRLLRGRAADRTDANPQPAALNQIFRDALIDSLPREARNDMFLPTANFPPRQQLIGLRQVKELYSRELERRHRVALRALKMRRELERCFIIGNGPSLNVTDLDKLKHEATFATNAFFLKMQDLGWTPTYYVVEDRLVAEDRAQPINELKGPTKLFPANLRYVLEPNAETIFFDHRPRPSFPDGFDFSFEADQCTYAGGTVTFTCMQLAAYLGYKEIILVGVDADYAIPADAKISGDGRVKQIDMPSDDPNHFHPDYFGKGKRWHQPNVDIMLKAYEKAQRACSERGVKILNATKGGKLEVFPRVEYDELFIPTDSVSVSSRSAAEYGSAIRLLLIDHTLIGDGTATGEVKANLFADWPPDQLMQIAVAPYGGLLAKAGSEEKTVDGDRGVAMSRIWPVIAKFQPQVILYRPVPDMGLLHECAMSIIDEAGLPVAVWIMDDWPTFLRGRDPAQFASLESDWRRLVAKASLRISISDAMSAAFEHRYGRPFLPIANGVDPADWRPVDSRPNGSFKVRYAGSLSENMTLETVRRVAAAVEMLADEDLDIRFEIKTRPLWRRRAGHCFAGFDRTFLIAEDMPAEKYRAWLQEGDATIIAYNFDQPSIDYVRYSIANKLPECLAAGAPVIAIGPAEIASMTTLAELDCAVCLSTPDTTAIASAIRALATDAGRRTALADAARTAAFAHFSVRRRRQELTSAMMEIADPAKALSLPRTAHARVDESEIVAGLANARRGREHVMLDIGAHVGSSADYFHRLGWTVYCLEPDAENRRKLTAKFGGEENVIIDARAVSDVKTSSAPFFSSPESSGISGLSAFHETHAETARVDVTTLADLVEEYEINRIDFLKIDVEGFDLAVLRGAPWDKTRPSIVECEFEDQKTIPLGHTWRDIADFLRGKGYAVYVSEWLPVLRYGVAHDWRRVFAYGDQEVAPGAWGNILAFTEDPGMDAVTREFSSRLKCSPPGDRESVGANLADGTDADARSASGFAPYRPATSEVRNASPRTGALASFAVRVARQIWRRRVWTLPLLFAGLLAFAATLHPAFDGVRILAWFILALLTLFAVVIYLIYRSHAFAERTLLDIAALSYQTQELSNQQARISAEIARLAKDISGARLSARGDAERTRAGRES